jgi:hypothetical protein
MFSADDGPDGPEGAKGDGPPLGKIETVEDPIVFLSIPPTELGVVTRIGSFGFTNGLGDDVG